MLRSFVVAGLGFALTAGISLAQITNAPPVSDGHTQSDQQKQSEQQSGSSHLPNAPTPAGVPSRPRPAQQPKRILGVMPNYRAVSAGELPPPPTPKEAFRIATQNSFDYSSFVFVGITSLFAEGSNSHPKLGKGIGGYYGYYWRGFVDKTDGNYWVVFALPTVLREDERYYAKGEGPLMNRAFYSATRILVTPNYHGKSTFNASEIFGRGIAQSISLTYYPSNDRTLGDFAQKYAWALGRDAMTNVFREFWPDIATHLRPHSANAE